MRAMYKGSSFGWNPSEKQKELFNSLSRFILVYPNGSDSLVAFTAFRFEFEDEDEDSNILYCYDIQVSKTSQRHGLGRTLMNHLVKIGADFRMDKIMLTVFKGSFDSSGSVPPDSASQQISEHWTFTTILGRATSRYLPASLILPIKV
ncbi:hypothetical protein C8R45DRAFT_40010 [Mycena sanguinolenta]|nr:hypothetical protein C8R45DRAFT_40010 [Mycena sanguinolenta]